MIVKVDPRGISVSGETLPPGIVGTEHFNSATVSKVELFNEIPIVLL